MLKLPLLAIAIAIAAAGACKSQEVSPSGGEPVSGAAGDSASDSASAKPGEPAPTRRGTRAATKPAEPATPNMSGARPHQASNCPAALPGASTKIALTAEGVDVTVTSTDAAVERNILSLAEFHAHGGTAEASHPHDGKHGGSGRIGYCPIIVNETTQITTTVIPGGVTLHVNARSPNRIGELQELIKQRVVRLPGYLSS
jgi:hypothetical protein